jgi:hypothetical protein
MQGRVSTDSGLTFPVVHKVYFSGGTGFGCEAWRIESKSRYLGIFHCSVDVWSETGKAAER